MKLQKKFRQILLIFPVLGKTTHISLTPPTTRAPLAVLIIFYHSHRQNIHSQSRAKKCPNVCRRGFKSYFQIDTNNIFLELPLKVIFPQPSASPLKSETHGGDDVGIWALVPPHPWGILLYAVYTSSTLIHFYFHLILWIQLYRVVSIPIIFLIHILPQL